MNTLRAIGDEIAWARERAQVEGRGWWRWLGLAAEMAATVLFFAGAIIAGAVM